MPMLLDVVQELLIFFCCPWSLFLAIFVTTRCSTHDAKALWKSSIDEGEIDGNSQTMRKKKLHFSKITKSSQLCHGVHEKHTIYREKGLLRIREGSQKEQVPAFFYEKLLDVNTLLS